MQKPPPQYVKGLGGRRADFKGSSSFVVLRTGFENAEKEEEGEEEEEKERHEKLGARQQGPDKGTRN